MTTSFATIKTQHARRYVNQICCYFRDLNPATVSEDRDSVSFEFGECQLVADAGMLTVRLSADDLQIDRIEHLIGAHLARLAFRENPEITWKRPDQT